MYKWVDRPVEDHERALVEDGPEDESYHPEAIIVYLWVIAGVITLALVLS